MSVIQLEITYLFYNLRLCNERKERLFDRFLVPNLQILNPYRSESEHLFDNKMALLQLNLLNSYNKFSVTLCKIFDNFIEHLLKILRKIFRKNVFAIDSHDFEASGVA